MILVYFFFFFFFNDTATTEIYTLSLHDALPGSRRNDTERPVSCHALSAYNSTAPMRPVNAVVGLALILAGCGHSAPPAAPESGSSQPFAGGSPRRPTFHLGDDRAPVWLPDGSGLLYSFQRLDRPDRDRCLWLLPPAGGRLERTLCDETPAAADSTNVLTEPAPSVDGRLAYLLVGSETIDIAPGYTAVVLGTLGGTAGARVLRTFP